MKFLLRIATKDETFPTMMERFCRKEHNKERMSILMANVNIAPAQGDIVVADTSSLLIEGVALLSSLMGTTLVIPAVVVSELEANRAKASVGFLAREWLNLLESLRIQCGNSLVADGAEYAGVTVRVEPNHRSQTSLPEHLRTGSADSTVLAVARNIAEESEDSSVFLLTNDTPMKIHALYISIPCISASQQKIETFSGYVDVPVSDEDYQRLASDQDALRDFLRDYADDSADVPPNCVLRLVSDDGVDLKHSAIRIAGNVIAVPNKTRVMNIVARSQEQNIALAYLGAPAQDVPIVSLAGGAGCGKTLLTLASGVDAVKKGEYKNVLVFRSLHELGQGQEMGFLPGAVEDKMAPWAGAINDALEVIARNQKGARGAAKNGAGSQRVSEQVAKNVAHYQEIVEVSPITYLRGRSISDTFMVIEEAQNFSRREILNILSRAGEGTKIVLTWDANQVDSKYILPGDNAQVWKVVDNLKHSPLFSHVSLRESQRSAVAQLSADILQNL